MEKEKEKKKKKNNTRLPFFLFKTIIQNIMSRLDQVQSAE